MNSKVSLFGAKVLAAWRPPWLEQAGHVAALRFMAPRRRLTSAHSLLEGVKGMDFNENMLHDSATPVQHWAWTLSIFVSPVLLAEKLSCRLQHWVRSSTSSGSVPGRQPGVL